MGSEITGGDCYDLWLVGVDHLPRIADIYYSYSGSLGEIAKSDKKLFKESYAEASSYVEGEGYESENHTAIDELGSGSSVVYEAYAAARDEVQRIFATTGDTLDTLGRIVQLAAWQYAECDEANGDALSVFKDMISEEDPAIYPPGTGSTGYDSKPQGLDDIPETEYENEADYPEEKDEKKSEGYAHG